MVFLQSAHEHTCEKCKGETDPRLENTTVSSGTCENKLFLSHTITAHFGCTTLSLAIRPCSADSRMAESQNEYESAPLFISSLSAVKMFPTNLLKSQCSHYHNCPSQYQIRAQRSLVGDRDTNSGLHLLCMMRQISMQLAQSGSRKYLLDSQVASLGAIPAPSKSLCVCVCVKLYCIWCH